MLGLFQFPGFVLVLLFLISHEAQTADLTVDANVWEIPLPEQTIPDQVAMVGDSITFEWQGTHNVYIHPTGNCSIDGRVLVGFVSPSSYTFGYGDVGKVFFSCDVAGHCPARMYMTVTVKPCETDCPPSPAPVDSTPTLSPITVIRVEEETSGAVVVTSRTVATRMMAASLIATVVALLSL